MPRTIASSVKREPMCFRVTPKIRELVETAAKANGRSLAQEIEFRLERSFDREATVRAVLAEADKQMEQEFRAMAAQCGIPMRQLDS